MADEAVPPRPVFQSTSRKTFAARRFRYRNEPTRERDVLRVVRNWDETYRPTQLHSSPFSKHPGHPLPAPCPDTALAAFAQLAAIRVQTRRCLITLTCASTEWVLADCGPQTPLQATPKTPNASDLPWIGTSSFPRRESLSHHALSEWRNARRGRDSPADDDHYYTGGISEHTFIIEDLRHESNFQELNMVRHGPWIRFYCAVPLRDAMGSVLGSLTLLDDKPRFGISVAELSLLEDLSDTIVEHLSATLVRARRQRGERLIASLGLFHAGEDSLREWWLAQDDIRVLNTGRNVDKGTASDRQDRVDAEFGLPASSRDGTDGHETAVSDGQIQSHNFGLYATNAPNHTATTQSPSKDFRGRIDVLEQRPSPSDASKRGAKDIHDRGGVFDLARATASTYARASNLLREALGADGVAFVDAGTVTVPLHSIEHTMEGGTFNDDDGAEASGKESSDLEASDSSVERTLLCKILGASLRNSSTSPKAEAQGKQIDIPEHYLHRLIKRSPKGFVCYFDQQGQVYSSSDESSSQSSSEEVGTAKPRKRREYQRLGKILGGVRVLSFLPLWDEGYSRWKSCAFVWTTYAGHCLDQSEDLMFLKSFGNSMLAELSRLETMAADISKATFISSISHELRSPLHGILAGAEFLLETSLTDFQLEMTHAVSMAGKTLLDTVSHVLDYSKIKGSAKKREGAPIKGTLRESDHIKSDDFNAISSIDLARLTEEVVETIVTAQRLHNGDYQSQRNDKVSHAPVASTTGTVQSAALGSSNVSISLNIAHRKNWTVATQPGGWTRILTNLVGNAIKYTHEGHISVRLSVGAALKSGLHGSQRCPVRLSVEDTGIGMSETFIAHGLFTPFRQENPYAQGTGLGLSIVKQIARSMGAELEISSKLGKGTLAQIRFLAHFVDENAWDDVAFAPDSVAGAMTDLRIEHLQLLQRPSSQPNNSESFLSNSVAETAREWLGCKIIKDSHIAASDGASLCGISERDLTEWRREQPEGLADILDKIASKSSRFIVFAETMHSIALPIACETLPMTPIFVHQPIGPRKLLRAMASVQKSTTSGEWNSERSYSPRDTERQVRSKTIREIDTDGALGRENPGHQTSSELLSQEQSPRGSACYSSAQDMSDTAKSARLASVPHIKPCDTSSVSGSPDDSPMLSENQSAENEHNTILLVEDNEVNMKLLVALVTKLRVRYRCAINGLEAVQAYTQSPSQFFLILMDMSMPIMDGFVATSKIRQDENKRKLERTFIMALTGVTDVAEQQRAYDSGIDEFYNKPVRMKQLKGFIDAARERRRKSN